MKQAQAGTDRGYCGRFAPSPTGPLHFGSLVAALAGWLDARAQGGKWLLRIEDLDTPRNVSGARDEILRGLDACGLHWDEPVCRQSARIERYRAALDGLVASRQAFGCACSRRELADATANDDRQARYPGTCRAGLPAGKPVRAWRLRVDPGQIAFDDRLQGRYAQDVAAAVGDFVLLRADGIFAYQLAVVVDDAAQAITDIVRGADLLDSTPRQIYLQRALGVSTPSYLHVPVAVNAAGEKLSKQTQARAFDRHHPLVELRRALVFLGMPVDKFEGDGSVDALLAWAVMSWSVAHLPKLRSRPAPDTSLQSMSRPENSHGG